MLLLKSKLKSKPPKRKVRKRFHFSKTFTKSSYTTPNHGTSFEEICSLTIVNSKQSTMILICIISATFIPFKFFNKPIDTETETYTTLNSLLKSQSDTTISTLVHTVLISAISKVIRMNYDGFSDEYHNNIKIIEISDYIPIHTTQTPNVAYETLTSNRSFTPCSDMINDCTNYNQFVIDDCTNYNQFHNKYTNESECLYMFLLYKTQLRTAFAALHWT